MNWRLGVGYGIIQNLCFLCLFNINSLIKLCIVLILCVIEYICILLTCQSLSQTGEPWSYRATNKSKTHSQFSVIGRCRWGWCIKISTKVKIARVAQRPLSYYEFDKSKRLIYVKCQKQIFLSTFAPNTNVFFSFLP